MTRNRLGRPGYTLVEILVVMTLIILLAALALGVSQSGMFGSQKVIGAGDRASGWLLIAKQRAMRDGAPRGVRFYNTVGGVTGSPTAFTEAAYIEVPEPWVPNQAQEGNPNGARIVFVYAWTAATGSPPGPNTVTVSEVYFVGTKADMDEYDQRVSDNDSLILPEFGKAFKITTANGTVTPSTYLGPAIVAPAVATAANTLLIGGTSGNQNARRIVLGSAIDLSTAGTKTVNTSDHTATMTTYKFGFQRPAQPLLGEPALQMSGGTSIDFRFPVPAATLGAAVEPALPLMPGGYRTWSSPPPLPLGSMTPNAGPYNPPTSIGVVAQGDPAVSGGSFFDILFSPSGQVLNNNAGLICLWVRETSKTPHPRQYDTLGKSDCDGSPASVPPVNTNDLAGPQVLIVVNTRNGLLSTQPINPPPAAANVNYDPYSFAKDGINSGL